MRKGTIFVATFEFSILQVIPITVAYREIVYSFYTQSTGLKEKILE
jgi:hypothetical protein